MDKKYLFIMFQGSGTNIKVWNEYTESKFLDKLKEIGEVYVYQDKTYNIWYYDKINPENKDYNDDIDIDLSYVDIKFHTKMIYQDINLKYKGYSYIPIGWSAGAYLAYYFAQKYQKYCKMCILLDPCAITSKNIKLRLNYLYKDIKHLHPITNNKFKKMLDNWKINNDNIDDGYLILYLTLYIRTLFALNNLSLELPVPTISFVNIQKPQKEEYSIEFNNKTRLEEVKILKKINPKKYFPYIFENKGHYIFNKRQPANKIISIIKQYLANNL